MIGEEPYSAGGLVSGPPVKVDFAPGEQLWMRDGRVYRWTGEWWVRTPEDEPNPLATMGPGLVARLRAQIDAWLADTPTP